MTTQLLYLHCLEYPQQADEVYYQPIRIFGHENLEIGDGNEGNFRLAFPGSIPLWQLNN